MSRSTPIRLAALAALLFVLTLLAARSVRSDEVSARDLSPAQVVQITVPVEIIEVGEDPAVLEIQVPR